MHANQTQPFRFQLRQANNPNGNQCDCKNYLKKLAFQSMQLNVSHDKVTSYQIKNFLILKPKNHCDWP